MWSLFVCFGHWLSISVRSRVSRNEIEPRRWYPVRTYLTVSTARRSDVTPVLRKLPLGKSEPRGPSVHVSVSPETLPPPTSGVGRDLHLKEGYQISDSLGLLLVDYGQRLEI